MQVKRGADAVSDHHLLLMTAKLRLKRHSTTSSTTTRYDLRNQEVEKRFQISLKNRYQILQSEGVDGDGDVETQWQQSKNTWLDTCKDILGKRKTKHQDWVSVDTLQKLKERRRKRR